MRKGWHLAWAGALYLALAGVLLRAALRHPSIRVAGNADFHVLDHLWHCWWAKYSIAQGVSFFFCPLIDFPRGVNVAGDMFTFTFPFASVPLQHMFGLVGAYNLMALMGLALAGFGGYLVCRRVTRDSFTSLLGGVIYGFSPFLQVELSNGMMEQVLGTALLPYFMLALLAVNDQPRARNIAGAGALIALLAFSSLFCLIFAALLLPFGLLHGWTHAQPCDRQRLRAAYRIIALFGLMVVTGVVAGLTFAQTESMKHVSWMAYVENPVMKNKVCLDLIRFFSAAEISGGTSIAAGGTVVLVPFGVYMGKAVVLLSLMALVFPARAWRPWKTGLLLVILLALGPYLNIGGQTELLGGARIPLPDRFILGVLPQATRILATHNYRFMSLAMLFAGMLSTLMLGAIFSRLGVGTAVRRAIIAALCFFTLVDFGGAIKREHVLALPFASAAVPSAYEALKGRAQGAVLDVPLPYAHTCCHGMNGRYMYYQTHHGRPIWAGGADILKPEKRDLPLVRAARQMAVGQAWSLEGAALLDDCAAIYQMGFRYVAVHRDQMANRDYLRFRQLAERHIGKSLADADGVTIYELPRAQPAGTRQNTGAGQAER